MISTGCIDCRAPPRIIPLRERSVGATKRFELYLNNDRGSAFCSLHRKVDLGPQDFGVNDSLLLLAHAARAVKVGLFLVSPVC